MQNIVKNPDFKDDISYTPYHKWEEYSDGTDSHHWCDLMSVNWAWNQAVWAPEFYCTCLLIHVQDIITQDPEIHGSTFIPIILSSDKMTVSVVTRQNDYYPLYLSVGNIHNNICCAHRNALVLVGFLAITKSKPDSLSA